MIRKLKFKAINVEDKVQIKGFMKEIRALENDLRALLKVETVGEATKEIKYHKKFDINI